jgi:hypothetical protein
MLVKTSMISFPALPRLPLLGRVGEQDLDNVIISKGYFP